MENTTPLISIIIPVYNVSAYLKECLESVCAQTYSNLEIICVNDGSTDNSGDILAEFAQKDKRIVVVTQQNEGLSGARNTGLSLATGKYIAFVDSDDVLHPVCISIALRAMLEYKAQMLNFAYISFSNLSDLAWTKYSFTGGLRCVENPFLLGFGDEGLKIPFVVWNKLYTRDLIDHLRFLPVRTFEDFPFTLAILSKHPKTVSIAHHLYGYRNNPKSLSASNNPQQIKDFHQGILSVCDIYQNNSHDRTIIIQHALPRLLKNQLYRCRHAQKAIQNEMFDTFARELKDLKQRGWLSVKDWWHNRKYVTYQYIMWKYGK